MMGHREKLVGALEYTYLTGARFYVIQQVETKRRTKRNFRRRIRRHNRQELKYNALHDLWD